MITIFTDGSARGNPGPGGWGAIVANETEVLELGGHEEHTTNNRMELKGAIEALKGTEEGDEITLHTDSEYVVKGITVWVHGWQQKGWRTAAKKAVLNQDLWQELVDVSAGKDIKWQVVAGHSGLSANDRCDEIATAFADKTKIDLYDGPRKQYLVSLKA